MKLIYNVEDKPKFSQVIVFAIQQLLAIMAATIAVPAEDSGDGWFTFQDYVADGFRSGCNNEVYFHIKNGGKYEIRESTWSQGETGWVVSDWFPKMGDHFRVWRG